MWLLVEHLAKSSLHRPKPFHIWLLDTGGNLLICIDQLGAQSPLSFLSHPSHSFLSNTLVLHSVQSTMAVTEDYKAASQQIEHHDASQTSSENGVAAGADLEKSPTQVANARREIDPDRVTKKTWLVVFVRIVSPLFIEATSDSSCRCLPCPMVSRSGPCLSSAQSKARWLYHSAVNTSWVLG